MTTSINVEGKIESGLLPDVVQILAGRPDLAGRLIVRGDAGKEGLIWFQNGCMISASYGARRDERAIQSILSLKHGLFAFEPSAEIPAATIQGSAMAVLLDCMRMMDEQSGKAPELDVSARPGAVQAADRQGGTEAGEASAFVLKAKSESPGAPVIRATVTPQAANPESLEHHWGARRAPAAPVPGPSPKREFAVLPGMKHNAFQPKLPAAVEAPAPAIPPARTVPDRRPVLLVLAGGLAAMMMVSVTLWSTGPAPQAKPVIKAPEPVAARATPAAPVAPQPGVAPVSAAADPFIWPPLVLSGIMAGRHGEQCALINGRFVSEGESLDGVRIQSIVPGRITVSYQGASKVLPLDLPRGITSGVLARRR